MGISCKEPKPPYPARHVVVGKLAKDLALVLVGQEPGAERHLVESGNVLVRTLNGLLEREHNGAAVVVLQLVTPRRRKGRR